MALLASDPQLCFDHCSWNFTNTATNQTQEFNGTCASPGSKSAGPWCYVEPSTCKQQPLKDQTGQSYDNCATNASTHTLDTGAALSPSPGSQQVTQQGAILPGAASVSACGAAVCLHLRMIEGRQRMVARRLS